MTADIKQIPKETNAGKSHTKHTQLVLFGHPEQTKSYQTGEANLQEADEMFQKNNTRVNQI